MYLVYDISNNNGDINNSEFLAQVENIDDVKGYISHGPLTLLHILGYCLYTDDVYNKYMVIDTNFNQTNPVLIPFIRDYKINEII